MARTAGRVRIRKKGKKRGPKSYREKAVFPKGAGIAKRRQWRRNNKLDTETMKRYRRGYNTIWSCPQAARYCRNLKHFPRPKTCNPHNQHGGVMPALPGEVTLSGKQAERIFEAVAESGTVSYPMLCCVSQLSVFGFKTTS